LLGEVAAEDLITQSDFRAIARIGQHITRIHTNAPPLIKVSGQRDQILERSRKLYCKPVAEVVVMPMQQVHHYGIELTYDSPASIFDATGLLRWV